MSKRASHGLINFPTYVVCDQLVQLFVAMVDKFDKREKGQLAAVATALLRIESTNKTIRQHIQTNKRLCYYRFFFHTAVETNIPRRFLDGTFGVRLFTGGFGVGPSNPERFNPLTSIDVLHDRVATANRLSTLSIDQVLVKSAKYMSDDLPTGVGPRVAAFVGRARFITQNRANAHPPWRMRCDFATCNCEFLGAANNGSASANPALADIFGEPVTESEASDDDDDEPPVIGYWANACPCPLTTMPKRVFCSLACSLAYEDELVAAVPVRVSDANAYETFSSANGKVGLSRLSASTRAAFRRNDAAVRALREAMRTVKKRTVSTVSHKLVEKIHENIVDVLNVDLALLYAASALAESQEACKSRILPATAPGWREGDTRRFSRALERIKSIYLQYHRKADGIARDERFPAPWLRRVREAAEGLFPRVNV